MSIVLVEQFYDFAAELADQDAVGASLLSDGKSKVRYRPKSDC